MPKGDCFEVAAQLVLDDPDLVDALVCQGMPLGTGGEALGVRYWHAWVEVVDGDGPVWVIDQANGNDAMLLRDVYYSIGTIDAEKVHRYDRDEVIQQIVNTEHWGPWRNEDGSPYKVEEVKHVGQGGTTD